MTTQPAQTIEPELVFDQLTRIFASPEFSAGMRARQFLEHIVHEEMEGRGALLKGTALAMDVFGRGADFDPGSDPIVRTEAVKMRKALDHYYLTDGKSDRVLIAVPKGSYRPEIRLREPQKDAAARHAPPGLPLLTIAAFDGPAEGIAQLYRDGLPTEIALELARFGHVRVRDYSDGGAPAVIDHGYMLRGRVQSAASQVRVVLQLSRQPEGEIIWSERFELKAKEGNAFELQEYVARTCATKLADAYGALGQDVATGYAGRSREDAGVYEALLSFHSHMRTSRKSSLREFDALSRAALNDNPESGLAHALVALCHIEKVVLGLSEFDALIHDARATAEKAIALAPNCQEALFSAAVLALLQNDKSRFEILLARAVDTNPNGTLLTAMVGAWIAMAGALTKGCDLIRQAQSRNPLLPVWAKIPLALEHLGTGDSEAASDMVSDLDARDVAAEWAFIASIHKLAGRSDGAARAQAKLRDLRVDARGFLQSLPLEAELSKVLTSVWSDNPD